MWPELAVSLALAGLPRGAVAEAPPPRAATERPVPQDEKVLREVGQAYQRIKTMRATVHRQRSHPQVHVVEPVETGEFYLVRKSRRSFLLRLQIDEPRLQTLLVRDGRYQLFQPDLNQVVEGKADPESGLDAPEGHFLLFFLGGVGMTRKHDDVAVLGREVIAGGPAWHLRLTPRPGRGASFRRLDIWVDVQSGVPIRQESEEANGALTELRLDDARINVRIPESVFSLAIPAGVERLQR